MTGNSSLIPSARDLVMVLPRLAQRAGSLALHIPEQVDTVFNRLRSGGPIIATATAANTSAPAITRSAAAVFMQSSAAAFNRTLPATPGLFDWASSALNFDSFRFGGMFTYFGSRWALATFAVSIFLNRTHFYASSRQNLELQWRTRLILYALPIALLLAQSIWVLQAMKCQTSPDFPFLRYGDHTKNLAINFGGEGGFLHQLSSTLLFWQDDATTCKAMKMSLNEEDRLDVVGSFSLIWPFFISICVSSFVETLSCALQGRQPMPETGMTTFEHSLAFAETEAMISNALGLGVFSAPKALADKVDGVGGTPDNLLFLTRPMILRRRNVPAEVLLICFISCLSHLSSSILAITGKRQRYRLVNTGVWALCYLSAFAWSFVRVFQNPFGGENDLGFLRFPTVCIIGFLPHIMILLGVTLCALIYGIALLVTAISLPPDAPRDLTLRGRFAAAFHNLQANVQFSSSTSLRLNWQEDFYTNLLKVGFNVLTAASEAVYLNEENRVKVYDMTWLERERWNEVRAARRTGPDTWSDRHSGDIGAGPEHVPNRSGYANERKSNPDKKRQRMHGSNIGSGVGFTDRRARWELVADLANGILVLLMHIVARTVSSALLRLGVHRRPAWLVRWARLRSSRKTRLTSTQPLSNSRQDFYRLGADGRLILANDANVDVEFETRRHLTAQAGAGAESELDDQLYSWWKTGGWWGEADGSGDFQPTMDDNDDLTSMISESDATSAGSTAWDSDGQLTPTKYDPYPTTTGLDHGTALDVQELARLLHPKTAEEREEARMLSRHLQSDQLMTRSRYQKRLREERARVLLPYDHASKQHSHNHGEDEEESALERLILEYRLKAKQKQGGQSWQTGADGMGSGGPQCVVCQSSPRSILVWPCGCLSICDDCRVGVATRNFSNCLCCRTNVVAYSRLYVP